MKVCLVEQHIDPRCSCVSQALVAMAPMLRVNTTAVLQDTVNAMDAQSRSVCLRDSSFDP
jgi:hypothetical protein